MKTLTPKSLKKKYFCEYGDIIDTSQKVPFEINDVLTIDTIYSSGTNLNENLYIRTSACLPRWQMGAASGV